MSDVDYERSGEGDQASLDGYHDDQASLDDVADPDERPETIYVGGGRSNGKTEHWDAECWHLKQANRVLEKPADVTPVGYHDKCRKCTDAPSPATPSGGNPQAPEETVRASGGACPHEDTHCGGERDLRGGVLPCFECAREASDQLWSLFERRHAIRRAHAPDYEAMHRGRRA